MKYFISSGRCHGRSLFFPITLFSANAAIMDTIIVIRYQLTLLLVLRIELVASKKLTHAHPLLSLRLQLIQSNPAIGSPDVKVSFIVGREFSGLLVFFMVHNRHLKDLKRFAANGRPSRRIRTQSTYKVSDIAGGLTPVDRACFLEDFRRMPDGHTF